MAQAARKTPPELSGLARPLARGAREAALIILVAAVAYLFLALGSYDKNDPGWSFTGPVTEVVNYGGVVGAWFADVTLYLFGYLAYVFPLMLAGGGWVALQDHARLQALRWVYGVVRTMGLTMTLAGGSGLATLHCKSDKLPLNAGGILGDIVGNGLAAAFSPFGSTLFLMAMLLTGMTLLTGLSWLWLMDTTGRYTLLAGHHVLLALAAGRRGVLILRERLRAPQEWERDGREPGAGEQWGDNVGRAAERQSPTIQMPLPAELMDEAFQHRAAQSGQGVAEAASKSGHNKRHCERTIPKSERAEREQRALAPTPAVTERVLPSLALLDQPPPRSHPVSQDALQAMSRQVEMKLMDFGVQADVVAVHPGPVITRFELQLAAGVKVSRVSGLAKDLARSLSTISVRVVEIIPGKTVIGLELPNEHRELVTFGELVNAQAFEKSASPLTLALGHDISGTSVVVDLAKMPHLLVAGTTGSGKSVAVNAMILSLLYKSSARDVRLIMIDPKMLELSIYDGIAHLLAPVVTDMKDAANALRWSVAEMERRYKLMAKLGVRNIAGYNRKVHEAAEKSMPIADPFFVPPKSALDESVSDDGREPPQAPGLETLPFIVVVVDELADLMMVTGKKIEELIARLAQKARASGIHLILATQRPSVDVITGLIKANIPSRIGFQVSSKIDSRTILDQAGAEQLLGHGDMLYLTPGMPAPTRVHGAFVADNEVHRVVEALKALGEPSYIDEVINGPSETDAPIPGMALLDDTGGEGDALYDQGVRIVTESRRASISGVQRRLKIGYNRAARMIEQMEMAGIVGPLQSNGNREVIAPPPPAD
ncbi:MAG: DUF87 domain-containing protein [Gammaproteobacteria bacterium]|nr:DUF87 domain-containing protein [Gammaproteobacteria bacterium]